MSTPTILQTIYRQRAKDVELAKSTPGTTPADIAALLASHVAPPLIPLIPRLTRNPSTTSDATPSPSLMAEIKRASPSKGPIAPTVNVAAQALTYALAGASVISVLTEPTWFLGSLLDLRLVRQAIDTLPDRPAVLRKEFILDEYQIAEARLHGADTVLLIVAMLPEDRLRALYAYSLSLGMEPLVEVNNAAEMQTALDLGAKVIGVNNRNLHDFNVDMDTTSRLVDMVRDRDVILCSLSGISTPADVQLYKDQGVRAVLVGEALMRAPDPNTFIQSLLNWPSPSPPLSPSEHEKPLLMISGITIIEEAIDFISEDGADMLGLIFDPHNNQSEESTIDEPTEFARNLAIYRRSDPRYFAPRTFPPASDPALPWFAAQKRNLLATAVRPLLVGIFRNHTLPEIIHTTASVKLDLVVVDASVPAGWIPHIPVPVIRRFRPGSTSTDSEIALPGVHSFVLLEQEEGKDLGAVVDVVVGRGEAPGWPLPVILGGALTEESLKEALETVHPWAVELSVEEGEESMSPSEMRKLLKMVKRA